MKKFKMIFINILVIWELNIFKFYGVFRCFKENKENVIKINIFFIKMLLKLMFFIILLYKLSMC